VACAAAPTNTAASEAVTPAAEVEMKPVSHGYAAHQFNCGTDQGCETRRPRPGLRISMLRKLLPDGAVFLSTQRHQNAETTVRMPQERTPQRCWLNINQRLSRAYQD
jgi:hypothetical protein